MRNRAPRRRPATIAAVAALVTGLLVAVASTTPSAAVDGPTCAKVLDPVPGSIDDATRYDLRSAVTCLVNGERAAWGLPELTSYASLDAAADLHTTWMGSTHTFSHEETGPGSHATPGDRATASGYAWSHVAENLAAGQDSAFAVVDAWLHSPGHCRNLMSPEVAHLGLGVSNETVVVGGREVGPIWTQVLGRGAGEDAPSDDTAAATACAEGQDFPARSAAFASGAFTITETDFAGRAVQGPDETATVDPDDTTAMERMFTLTNDTESVLRNPGFRATITHRPVEQDYLTEPNVTCEADDPTRDGYVLEEVGCRTGGDGQAYVEAAVPPGRSVRVKVSSLNGPSDEEHVGERTGWRITFTGRHLDTGELVPASVQPSYSQVWTWSRSHTAVGLGLRSALDPPDEPQQVVDATGRATWTVPVVNRGRDAYPKALTLFVSGARGATVESATLAGATCAPGTSFESDHRPGIRCALPARLLAGGSTRNLVVVARAGSNATGSPDRGAIGVSLGDPVANEAFGTDVSLSGYVVDRLPTDYPGVRSGRVATTENLDDQERATGFCRADDDCDLDGDGVADADQKARSTLAVKATGAKRKATFAITVTAARKPATGTVSVALRGKVLKRVTLSRGRATITLLKQAKGRRSYTITYSGNRSTTSSTRTVTVTVR